VRISVDEHACSVRIAYSPYHEAVLLDDSQTDGYLKAEMGADGASREVLQANGCPSWKLAAQ